MSINAIHDVPPFGFISLEQMDAIAGPPTTADQATPPTDRDVTALDVLATAGRPACDS